LAGGTGTQGADALAEALVEAQAEAEARPTRRSQRQRKAPMTVGVEIETGLTTATTSHIQFVAFA